MHNQWLDSAEDIQWLKDTCLKGVELPADYQGFQAAVLEGNEDCPYAVNLYMSKAATISDDFCRVRFADHATVVTRCSGETGEVI
jgi:hypothetical protein